MRTIKKYYVRQIVACWLVFYMLFGVPIQVAMADPSPGAGVHPSTGAGGYTATRGGTAVWDGANTTTLTAPDGSIFTFNNFDIGSAQIVNINQLASAATLARVTDGAATGIFGRLNAKGTFFLVNPSGIVFGPDAFINARNFVGSTLRMNDTVFENFADDLSDTISFYTEVGDVGTIINDGGVIGSDGSGLNEYLTESVYLLAKKVTNAGTIVSPGGAVVMAAGDTAVLGKPGSAVVVRIEELGSVSSTADGMGDVINEGTITAPGGQIVLAAGDIFSLPITNDDRAVKVHWGSGTVTQNGTINASAVTGDGGTVSLTSADATTLGASSETYANAGTGGDSGLVSVHSQGTSTVELGAKIEATGGYYPTPLQSDVDIALGQNPDDVSVVHIIQDNSVEIIGDTINFDNALSTINVTASDPDKKGKVYFEADNLTIADILLDNHDNIILAGYIEDMSRGYWIGDQFYPGSDIELASHASSGMIDVRAFSLDGGNPILGGALADGIITGGRGDITFRSLLMNGGIDLTPRDADGVIIQGLDLIDIETVTGKSGQDRRFPYDAGNIFMVAGNNGITAGNLLSYLVGGENLDYEPGRIRLLAAGTSGAISVKTMYVNGGGVTEISAIATGDLTVKGAVNAITHEVSEEDKTIGFARICLISENGSVLVDTRIIDVTQVNPTNNVAINVQGKFKAIGTVKIKAGGDITVNTTNDNAVSVDAFARVSPPADQTPPYTADAIVEIDAGGTINLEGIDLQAKLSGATATVHRDDSSAGTFENEATIVKKDKKVGIATATLKINQAEDCIDCPIPPGLILEIAAVDDFYTQHMNKLIDTYNDPAYNHVLVNDKGTFSIISYTDPVISGTNTQLGTLTFDKTTGEFVYNPDGSGFAHDSVEFEYSVLYIDTESGTVLTDSATVTINYTNSAPTFAGDLGSLHMNTDVPGIDLLDPLYVTNADGDQLYILVNGQLVQSGDVINGNVIDIANLEYDGTNWTYKSADGYKGGESFVITLWDGEYDYTGGTKGGMVFPEGGSGSLLVNMTNELPSGDSWLGTTHMDTPIVDGSLQTDNFTDIDGDSIDVVVASPSSDDYDGPFGGDLSYDGTYDYDPPEYVLPGYVGDDVDNFDDGAYVISENADDRFNVRLWDGEYAYTSDGDGGFTKTKVYGEGTISVDITNTLPTAGGDLGETPSNTILIVPQTGTTSPVVVLDPEPDTLSIVQDTYSGSAGGTLVFDGTQWIYTPGPGQKVGTEKFIVDVSDGQNDWVFEQSDNGWKAIGTPEYGTGKVSVLVSEEEIVSVPAAPLAVLEFPEIGGCPALMTWLAGELGVGEEQIQIYMANVLAFSRDIHPCDICARLMNATRVVDNVGAGRAAALASMITAEIGPLAGPPSEEQMALIATALATPIENTQYASATELIDAVVAYISILTDEMGMEATDAIALFMDKHGEPITEDASVAAYFGSLLSSL